MAGKLKEFTANLNASGVDAAGLKKLSSDVHKAMVENGYSDDGCHTECSVQVVIGPDGKPAPTVVCRLVCGF